MARFCHPGAMPSPEKIGMPYRCDGVRDARLLCRHRTTTAPRDTDHRSDGARVAPVCKGEEAMHGITPTRPSRRSAERGAQRRIAIGASLLAVTLSALVCGNATAAASSPLGQCQVRLRVIVHRISINNGALSSYRSSSGTASCTGRVGPWLMGGGSGWSTGSGTLRTVDTRAAAGTGSCQVTRARGAFWAEVPRQAWFHPPMVALGAGYRLQSRSGGLDVIGSGRLIRTAQSPVSSRLRFTGTATIAAAHGQSCTAARWAGSLTFSLAVH